MIADSFFQQGFTHDVCEDYTLHGGDYAIVSDGCSNKGKSIKTDWGSRVLSLMAENQLPSFLKGEKDDVMSNPMTFIQEVVDHAENFLTHLSGLEKNCLTATLGVVCLKENSLRTILCGDGVIGARRRNGPWEFYAYEAVSGACFYPIYLNCPQSTEAFFGRDTTHTVRSYSINYSDVQSLSESTDKLSLTPSKPWFDHDFPIEKYDTAFVGTDGLTSFVQRVNTGTSLTNVPVPLHEALGVLFDEITFRSGFLRFQRSWAFRRRTKGTFQSREWKNADDCSVGMLHVE
jgi:hypothetical protein